jgi:hypothetical protein
MFRYPAAWIESNMLDYHTLQQRILSRLTFAINLLNNDNGVIFVYIFLCYIILIYIYVELTVQ